MIIRICTLIDSLLDDSSSQVVFHHERIQYPPHVLFLLHIVGASLSEPHTSETALRTCVCVLHSLIPRLPLFLPSVCVHNNTREQKTSEKRGRSGSIHHVNDVRWT